MRIQLLLTKKIILFILKASVFIKQKTYLNLLDYTKIKDKINNEYEFTKFIDTESKEILGTDIKAFLNADTF